MRAFKRNLWSAVGVAKCSGDWVTERGPRKVLEIRFSYETSFCLSSFECPGPRRGSGNALLAATFGAAARTFWYGGRGPWHNLHPKCAKGWASLQCMGHTVAKTGSRHVLDLAVRSLTAWNRLCAEVQGGSAC